MKIVLVGGGAIGRLFASYLGQGDNEVILLDSDTQVVGAISSGGIGVVPAGGEQPTTRPAVAVAALADGSRISSSDLVLLMVKSFSTRPAAQSIAHLIHDDCPLLTMQTGLGNVEILEKIVPRRTIMAGLTFMSGTALGSDQVRHGGEGMTYIGELDGEISDRLERICRCFVRSGIATQAAGRIVGRLWNKVIVYSAINSLSALLKVPNGCLIGGMDSITLMKRLLDEGRAVADALGIDLVHDDLYEQLFAACERSANNLSAMLQDILNDRPTEIDAQSGAICRYGEEMGVAVPTQQTMLEMIKLIEKWRPGLEQL